MIRRNCDTNTFFFGILWFAKVLNLLLVMVGIIMVIVQRPASFKVGFGKWGVLKQWSATVQQGKMSHLKLTPITATITLMSSKTKSLISHKASCVCLVMFFEPILKCWILQQFSLQWQTNPASTYSASDATVLCNCWNHEFIRIHHCI